jgi:outer membrane lipoprotein
MMIKSKSGCFVLSSLFVLVMVGCSYVISPEMRERASKDTAFPMVFQDPDAYQGSIVIWGGVVDDAYSSPEGTRIIVIDRPLDSSGTPRANADPRGRFIAQTSERLELGEYRKGRKLALAGEIMGKETQPLGETQYTYPVVEISELHLIREEAIPPYRPDDPWRRHYGRGGSDYGDWSLGL